MKDHVSRARKTPRAERGHSRARRAGQGRTRASRNKERGQVKRPHGDDRRGGPEARCRGRGAATPRPSKTRGAGRCRAGSARRSARTAGGWSARERSSGRIRTCCFGKSEMSAGVRCCLPACPSRAAAPRDPGLARPRGSAASGVAAVEDVPGAVVDDDELVENQGVAQGPERQRQAETRGAPRRKRVGRWRGAGTAGPRAASSSRGASARAEERVSAASARLAPARTVEVRGRTWSVAAGSRR